MKGTVAPTAWQPAMLAYLERWRDTPAQSAARDAPAAVAGHLATLPPGAEPWAARACAPSTPPALTEYPAGGYWGLAAETRVAMLHALVHDALDTWRFRSVPVRGRGPRFQACRRTHDEGLPHCSGRSDTATWLSRPCWSGGKQLSLHACREIIEKKMEVQAEESKERKAELAQVGGAGPGGWRRPLARQLAPARPACVWLRLGIAWDIGHSRVTLSPSLYRHQARKATRAAILAARDQEIAVLVAR